MKTALRDPGLARPSMSPEGRCAVISAPDFPGLNVPVYATQSSPAGFFERDVESISHLWKK